MFRISSQIQILLGLALLFVFYGLIDRFPEIYSNISQNYKLVALFGYRWIFSIVITIFIMICYIVFIAFYRIAHRDSEVNTIQRTTVSFLQIVTALTFISLLSIYYVNDIQSVIYIIYGFFLLSSIVIGVGNFMIDRRLDILMRKDPSSGTTKNQTNGFLERLFGNGSYISEDSRYSSNDEPNQKSDRNIFTQHEADQSVNKGEEVSSNNQYPEIDEGLLDFGPTYSEQTGIQNSEIPEQNYNLDENSEDSVRFKFKNNFLFSSKMVIVDNSTADAFKI